MPKYIGILSFISNIIDNTNKVNWILTKGYWGVNYLSVLAILYQTGLLGLDLASNACSTF